jgi:hypothetical protein
MTMDPTSQPLSERLLKGAMKLGALWRSKRRCLLGWSFTPEDICMEPCKCEVKTDFCKGRLLWIVLAIQNGQLEDAEFGDYGLATTVMTAKQFDATGLTMSIPVKDVGEIKVGPKGAMSMAHLAKLYQDPQSAISIFALIKAFPKARIEGIIEPSKEVVA